MGDQYACEAQPADYQLNKHLEHSLVTIFIIYSLITLLKKKYIEKLFI